MVRPAASIRPVSQIVTQRQLNIAPTLTIRPGFPVRVIVSATLFSNPTKLTLAKLKLGPIADDKPVKITLELPAGLHRDLHHLLREFSAVRRDSQRPVAVRLIVLHVERFIATDRELCEGEAGGCAAESVRLIAGLSDRASSGPRPEICDVLDLAVVPQRYYGAGRTISSSISR